MVLYPYIVIDAPGYYGDEGGTVYSCHHSIAAARRAARRDAYVDVNGIRRRPRIAAYNHGLVRGDGFYRDMAPVPVPV